MSEHDEDYFTTDENDFFDDSPTGGKITAKDFLRRLVAMRPGGENRVEQETMVDAIEEAIAEEEHLVVQAGTGSGKSLGYAIPAIISGKRVAISTATKQLSEQIVSKDLPTINKALESYGGQGLSYALIKGRANYVCKRALNTLTNIEDSAPAGQESLFEEDEIPVERTEAQERGAEVTSILKWAEKTRTGDRSEAPAVSDKIWNTVSVTNAECVGKSACPFGEICFAEVARDRARAAQVVVANHAVVGADIASDNSILGEREVLVVDEVHELDNYLSSAWGTELSAKKVYDTATAVRRNIQVNETQARDKVEELISVSQEFEKALITVKAGLVEVLDEEVFNSLSAIADKCSQLDSRLNRLSEENDDRNIKGNYKSAANRIRELYNSVTLLLSTSEEVVRWFSRVEKDNEEVPATMHAAPLRVGPRLMSELHKQDTTLIATSATITVGGKFDAVVHDLALNEEIESLDGINGVLRRYPHRKFDAIDVGTPFNYSKQGMYYIPDAESFPAPVGKDRAEHSQAVLEETLELVKASDGRALILSTTASGARRIGEHLRKELKKQKIKHKVLIQNEAPPKQITEEFAADEHSILCATMGMWHGLDVQGSSLSLVVIDKIPFKPFDDPLSLARQKHAENMGRNGFMDVYVAGANVMLAQGVGRLVRAKTDRGVVAILDTRLRTKPYGRSMMRSLPPMRVFSDLDQVTAALRRLVSTYED